jgi:hypothetical protein
MRLSHYQNGRKMVGYTKMIQEAGFNGIAGIIWDAGFQKRMRDK